jgi:hypothetical protein
LVLVTLAGFDVRFGSEADIGLAVVDVRFTPKSGHCRTTLGCPLCAKSGLMHRSNLSLFDHLVGCGEQCLRDGQAERFGAS